MTLNKKCESCGNIFYKPVNRSLKDWNEKARFCSNSCKVYKQKSFYKYWEDKRRPGLINTNSKKTMFTKSNPGFCPPEKIHKTHGLTGTRFYSIWKSMKQRCENNKNKFYINYGGRGITIVWEKFEDFKDDMYQSYTEHVSKYGEKDTQIDRKNNDSNYSVDNCKWSTHKEQMRNTRNNHLITINGVTGCMTDWANKLGITYSALWKRLKKMSPEQAVNYEI